MILNTAHLIETWQQFTVLVIGDAMLDCYLTGTADRLCQEAPVPVVNITQRQDFPGGAANTAANLASLGAGVQLLSVMGDDPEADRLQTLLKQAGVATEPLLMSSQRSTLTKQRVVAGSQLLVRFDQGSTTAIAADLENQVLEQLRHWFPQCHAVVVSDYGYGILTPKVIHTLATLQAQFPRPLIVDSKRLAHYRSVGVTAVKPNYRETIALLGLPPQTADRTDQLLLHGDRLLELTGASIVVTTLDSEGAIVFESGQAPYCIPATPMPAHYTSGAGDTFVSALTLALAAGAPTRTAAFLASMATASVVTQPGTTTCSAESLRQAVLGDRAIAMSRL